MATALHPSASMSSFNSHCGEPDMDSFLDFSQMPSPSAGPSRLPASSAPSNLTSPATTVMPLDHADDLQTPAKPSHEYERWKQQTGLPTNSVPGLQMGSQSAFPPMFSNSGIGLDDMSLLGTTGLDEDWSTLRLSSDMPMDMDMNLTNQAYFFSGPSLASNSDDFVDPSAIASPEEPRTNVRVWPGMHQQQAQQQALARAQAQAQAQAQQQRQQQILQRQQQKLAEQTPRSAPSRRSASHQAIDPRVEETISRVVNQIRQSSALSSQNDPSSSSSLPQILRMKKDEDDMDEDERLLASEEGKKLSSKERRQLRNKVSARAFRSRRKEYIGQLEGEVAVKTTECNDLRSQNRALIEENARSRAFIEKLLRHAAFQPFLDDLSRDETLTMKMAAPVPSQQAPAPINTQAAKQDINRFQANPQPQLQELSRPENPQVGMTLVPETPLDISMLNLNTPSTWSMPQMNFYTPQVFAVMELPEGPASPIDTEMLSGKSVESYDSETIAAPEEIKHDYPVIEQPSFVAEEEAIVESPSSEADDLDEDDLFSTSSTTGASASFVLPTINIEKPESHFELRVTSEASEQATMEYLERLIARMTPAMQRIEARTAHLSL